LDGFLIFSFFSEEVASSPNWQNCLELEKKDFAFSERFLRARGPNRLKSDFISVQQGDKYEPNRFTQKDSHDPDGAHRIDDAGSLFDHR
jgi:hypothetical protein